MEMNSYSVSNTLKSVELEALNVKLPEPCQEQLDELKLFIDKLDVTNVNAATPTKNIKRVLVTGATGFLGRHFIADLLTNTTHYISKIYCPVRADSDDKALERLVGAMQDCGTWNPSFTSRLHVFHCDLKDEYFGLPLELYNKMTDDLDAVFHFAATLKLTSSFNKAFFNNCRPMRAILRLCLQGKKHKHLFHASTLGIFPQYSFGFSDEFKNKAVQAHAIPEVSDMEKKYSLETGGYFWSKFINELIVLTAQKKKGLNLALFRMPLMFTNSKTGFSSFGDPTVHVFFAALQLGWIVDFKNIRIEDSALSNEMMLRIAFNNDRKNTVYNCLCDCPMVPFESNFYDMIGYPCKQTSLKEFRSKCIEMGAALPINKYWTIIDYFYSYKANYQNYMLFPIDRSTVEEDCFPMPKRKDNITVFCKFLDWTRKVDIENRPVHIDLLIPSTNLESILVPSRKLCQQYNLDFNTVVKPHVIEGLCRICEELHVKESVMSIIILTLTMRLEARVQLHRLLQMYPEIKSQKLESPLFILGLPCTGTTFLHRLLEASGFFEAPHMEDQIALPSVEQILQPDKEVMTSRLEGIESLVDTYGVVYDSLHEVKLGIAAGDMVAHGCSFMSMEYDILYDLPKYSKWLESKALDVVYEEHYIWMQFVAWWRLQQNSNCGSRWCYNFPWHLRSLKLLLKMYADAKLVFIHRNVQDIKNSWCPLVQKHRLLYVDEIDNHQFEDDQHQHQSLTQLLANVFEFRKSHPEFETKWLDVQYDDIVTDPATVAQKIIRHADLNDV